MEHISACSPSRRTSFDVAGKHLPTQIMINFENDALSSDNASFRCLR